MIRSLRTQHRVTFTVLAVILPVLFVAGLRARRPIPSVPRLPDYESSFDQRSGFILWDEIGIKARISSSTIGRAKTFLDVIPVRELEEPDLLLYWDDRRPETGSLSEKAILLGSLKGVKPRRLIVPQSVPASVGYVILFSLAHQRVIASSPWQSPGGAQ